MCECCNDTMTIEKHEVMIPWSSKPMTILPG